MSLEWRVLKGITSEPNATFQAMLKRPWGTHVGAPAYPQRVGFIADWGYSTNSSSTLQHVINSLTDQINPPVIFYIAVRPQHYHLRIVPDNIRSSDDANETAKHKYVLPRFTRHASVQA